MTDLNYEITHYKSPFYENLIKELIFVQNQKRKIFLTMRSQKDLQKLSFEEKGLLKHIIERENEICTKIINVKRYIYSPLDKQPEPDESDYDIYGTDVL